MSEQSIQVTIVNHVAVDIAASPEAVWQTILEEYIEAKKFREIGYTIEPLDEPAAYLGGYRMRFEQDGALLDDRICRVSERDEAEHRLSIFADYLSAPKGMVVYATYHAAKTSEGTRYHLDCHGTLGIDPPAGGGQAEVAATVAEMKTEFDTALAGYLNTIKARLEARA